MDVVELEMVLKSEFGVEIPSVGIDSISELVESLAKAIEKKQATMAAWRDEINKVVEETARAVEPEIQWEVEYEETNTLPILFGVFDVQAEEDAMLTIDAANALDPMVEIGDELLFQVFPTLAIELDSLGYAERFRAVNSAVKRALSTVLQKTTSPIEQKVAKVLRAKLD